MRQPWIQALAASAVALTVAACGGGGGGGGFAAPPSGTAPGPASSNAQAPADPLTASNPGEPSGSEIPSLPTLPTPPMLPMLPTSEKLSGLTATGAPAANGGVSVRCATGAALTTTSDVGGAWTATLTDQTFPCLVSVSGGSLQAGQTLYSLAMDATPLNVTPLTGMVLASALGAAPTTLDVRTLGASASTALAQGLVKVNAILSASGYKPPSGNPLTAVFQATAGDSHDDLISTLMRSLDDEGISYDELLASIAAAGDAGVPVPLTHVYKAAELLPAAMPQLNNARLSVRDGELSMVLGSGDPSAVGAYVGSGTGNKAILQLPGLNGVKLSTFKDMTLEVKGESNYRNGSGLPNLYTYVNFLVDLQCTGQPLAAGSTIDQVRAQRRIVIFDPFYKFIQQDNSISSVDFFSAKFNYGTGGWRASAGASLGTGVFVPQPQGPGYNGSETLQGFDFQTYPNACIVDGISADGGLHRDTTDAQCATLNALAGSSPAICGRSHSGAIVVLGGSNVLTPSDWKVRKVRLNATNVRNFVFR